MKEKDFATAIVLSDNSHAMHAHKKYSDMYVRYVSDYRDMIDFEKCAGKPSSLLESAINSIKSDFCDRLYSDSSFMPGFIPGITAGSSVAKELAKAFDKLPYDKDHYVKNGWKLDGKIYGDDQTDYDVGVQHFELYPTKIPGMFVRNFEALEVDYKKLDIVFVDATKLEKSAKLRAVIGTRDNLPDKNVTKTKSLKPKANRQKKSKENINDER